MRQTKTLPQASRSVLTYQIVFFSYRKQGKLTKSNVSGFLCAFAFGEQRISSSLTLFARSLTCNDQIKLCVKSKRFLCAFALWGKENHEA
jgi:hypothetical protein